MNGPDTTRSRYEATMAGGAAEYADVLRALKALGVHACFTQTGGMNAAIEAHVDGGAYLLITDAEDSLAWERSEHVGWGVGVYPDEESQEQLAFRSTDSSDLLALMTLVTEVLREAIPDSH